METWESYVPVLLKAAMTQAFKKRGGAHVVPGSSVLVETLKQTMGAVNALDEVTVTKILRETLTMAFSISTVRFGSSVDGALSKTTDEVLNVFLDSITVRAKPNKPLFHAARLRRNLARAVFVELRDDWGGRDWVLKEALAVIAWLGSRSDLDRRTSNRQAGEADLLSSSQSICETISQVLVDPITSSSCTDRPKPVNMFDLGAALLSSPPNRTMLDIVDAHSSLRKRPINFGRVKDLCQKVHSGKEILSGKGTVEKQKRRGKRLMERVASLGLATFNVAPRLIRSGTRRMEIPNNSTGTWRNLAMKLESAIGIANRLTPGQSNRETALRRAADRRVGFSVLTRIAASDLEHAKIAHRRADGNSTFDFDNNNKNLNMKEAAAGRVAMVRRGLSPVFRRARGS